MTTGRTTKREPQIQNIPLRTETGRALRAAFTAPVIVTGVDYAELERRFAAPPQYNKDAVKRQE